MEMGPQLVDMCCELSTVQDVLSLRKWRKNCPGADQLIMTHHDSIIQMEVS